MDDNTLPKSIKNRYQLIILNNRYGLGRLNLIEIGINAPDFCLKDQNSAVVKLSYLTLRK
jgi:hypothetical protein